MSIQVSEVGRKVLLGTTAQNTTNYTPASINAAVSLQTLLNSLTPKSVGNIAASSSQVPKAASGILEATIVIEGTSTSRYRKDNVAPTTAIGHLIAAPSATTPVVLVVRGADEIAGFQIIGTANGNTITVSFDLADIT
jgi:hypothetical protein